MAFVLDGMALLLGILSVVDRSLYPAIGDH
jgi:hypothetical protein